MSSMPPMDSGFNDNQPPMDGGFDGGGAPTGGMGDSMPNQPVMNDGMGNDMMGDGPMNNQMPTDNQFDTNFDAGVDADEEQDPKTYIQQLTGKLSQTLRDYNKSLPQPDVDLDKYVAGMIVKQAIEGLSEEDTEEIIDKLNNGEDFNMDANNDNYNPDNNGNDMPMDDGMNDDMGNNMNNNGPQNQMESFIRDLHELTIKPSEKKDDQYQPKKLNTKKGYKVSPFLPK